MKKYHGIRLARIAVAVAVAAVLTACVAIGARCWFTRMQLLPAVMAGGALWLLLWLVATLVLGRIYCSTACPMGSLMDAVARLRMAMEKRRRPYRYAPASMQVRYLTVVLTAVCMAVGFSLVPSLLDPYSAYARIIATLRSLVALPAGRAAGVAVLSAVVAASSLAVVAAVAWRRGRTLCNTLCPVGGALGLLSRVALYHTEVNRPLCTGCLHCVDACKGLCINPADMSVDPSRCVVCFDCMDACPTGAITYRRTRHRIVDPLMQPAKPAGTAAMDAPADTPMRLDRRKFLALGVVAAAAAAGSRGSGSTPKAWDPAPMVPLNYPLPPGVNSRHSYMRRCTACGACTAACPTGVLRPSMRQLGVQHAMQPVMDYGAVACLTDCNACTRVCPSGALVPLTLAEKRRFVIGRVRIRLQNCISYGRGRHCGRCARVCPVRAIEMTQFSDGRIGPMARMDACTGCGLCVKACPSQPFKALVVEGME